MALDKLTADRLRSFEQVAQAVRTHRDGLEAAARDTLGAGDVPVGAVVDAVIGAIAAAADDLRAKSAAHQAELNDDHEPRAARDAQAAALYTAVVDARQAIRGMYDRSTLKALGQTGTIEQRADRLLATARALIESVPTVLPERTPKFAPLDPEALIGPMRDPASKLAEALAAVDREAREAEATLIARNAAMDAYDQIFGRGAGTLTALFRLAGLDEHARRVRPSLRRPGRVHETVDAEGELPADPQPDDEA